MLVQSSSSSRARSKRVMNQTMFDVPNPLVVHVLLLTHEFKYNVIHLPSSHSWYPQWLWQIHVFYVPKTHWRFPLFNLLRSVGPGRCLIVNWFYSVLQCHKQRYTLFPFQGFLVGATSYKSGATTKIITVFTRSGTDVRVNTSTRWSHVPEARWHLEIMSDCSHLL